MGDGATLTLALHSNLGLVPLLQLDEKLPMETIEMASPHTTLQNTLCLYVRHGRTEWTPLQQSGAGLSYPSNRNAYWHCAAVLWQYQPRWPNL